MSVIVLKTRPQRRLQEAGRRHSKLVHDLSRLATDRAAENLLARTPAAAAVHVEAAAYRAAIEAMRALIAATKRLQRRAHELAVKTQKTA